MTSETSGPHGAAFGMPGNSRSQPMPNSTAVWSYVRELQGAAVPDPAKLGPLLDLYARPVYAFLRRRGHRPEEAEDLVQAFFERFLERGWIDRADPARGRFRTFLLTLLTRFVRDERALAGRRFDRRVGSLDALAAGDASFDVPAHATPEDAFNLGWARAVLARTWTRFGEECRAAGHPDWPDALDAWLAERACGRPDLAALAATLGLGENALRHALERSKRLYRDALRAEVRATIDADATEADVDAEIAALPETLSLDEAP